jgi:hypothetical protein
MEGGLDHINIWIDFGEIMLAKFCADVLHYEINCHMIVSSMPWMDDGTDEWMDRWTGHVGTWHYTINLCNDDIINAFISSTCIIISHAGKNDAHSWMFIS